MWKQLLISPRDWSCSRPCRTLPSAPSRNSLCKSPLGSVLMATKGYAAPEVERVYTRAREFCRQVGETPQLFPVLCGLWGFYTNRAELQTGRELGEQLLRLAQRIEPTAPCRGTLYARVEFVLDWRVCCWPVHTWNRALPCTTSSSTIPWLSSMGRILGSPARPSSAWTLWALGYPDQARGKCKRSSP